VNAFSERRVSDEIVLDPSKTAVLVVDMLNEFLSEGGQMVLLEGRTTIDPIKRLVQAARRSSTRVIWVCDEHPHPEDREFQKRVPHCFSGTWGAEIVKELTPLADEIRIGKRRYSGFFETDLDLRLRDWNVSQLVVSGVVTNICVRSTVHDAFFRGYQVVVPVECVAATSEREQASSLYDIETHFGKVMQLEEVLAMLVMPSSTAA
jgi:ureidoacrylate peracid hydrolase